MRSLKATLSILLITVLSTLCFAQTIRKETIKTDSVDHQTTISQTGMYDGTKSEEAKKFFDQAATFADKQDFNNAKIFYLKAIKKDPNYVEAYDNLGLVYRRLGDFNKAIEYYKKSIEIYPNGQTAHQNLAAVYVINSDTDNAILEYKTIVKISPDDPEGYFGLANTYMTNSNFEQALTNANKALELYLNTNSHHLGDGYYLVGLIYYYQGEKEKAAKYIRLAEINGAKIHQQIRSELLKEEQVEEQSYQLETKEDYVKYEQNVIDGFNWLMKSPVDEELEKRKEISAFLIKWITGSPNVTIEISAEIVTYIKCSECLLMFMGGWTKYVLETDNHDNFNGNLAGTESVLKFYSANKEVLGKNKEIEKLIKLKNNNILRSHIKSNL